MRGSRKHISSGPNGENDGDGSHAVPEDGKSRGENLRNYKAIIPKNNNDEKKQRKNLKVIKRSNNVFQALDLPTLCNMNPRSVYNKRDEFHEFVKEEEIDLLFMSESWERNNLTLDKIIKLDDFEIISNVSQRKNPGGRPAIIVNKRKFQVQNITNTLVQIPWGVEAVWSILTPKNVSNDSKI